jgi:autotransporter adhesin
MSYQSPIHQEFYLMTTLKTRLFTTAAVIGVLVLASTAAMAGPGTELGTGASTSDASNTAVGLTSTATGIQSSAFGNLSSASANNSTAVGTNAQATGGESTAIGFSSTANGGGSVAIGDSSTANVDSGVAIGQGASVTGANSVALGAGSVAGDANTVSVGDVGSERRVTNVAEATGDTDAVNLLQAQGLADTAEANANTYTDSVATTTLSSANAYSDAGDAATLSSANSYADAGDAATLSSANAYSDAGDATTLASANAYSDALFNDSREYAAEGIAAALAQPGTILPGVGKKYLGFQVGHYDGKTAIGIGFSMQPNETVVINAGVSSAGDHVASRAGIGFIW